MARPTCPARLAHCDCRARGVMTDWKRDGLCDLMRQGLATYTAPKSKRAAAPVDTRPIVACDDCLNWHRKGKHTADLDTRKANRKAARR